MSNKSFKKPLKIKYNVTQYLIVGVVCLPLLIWFGINAENKWHLSNALTIFIMCCIILAVWLSWVGIRTSIEKRAKKIRLEKKENKLKNDYKR